MNCQLYGTPERHLDPPCRPESTADFQTCPAEIGNGAVVEVTAWVDDFGQPDFDKPVAVMYKGVQVNDLVTDEGWDDIKYQVTEWIKTA